MEPCWLPGGAKRTLPALQRMPILVLASEASYHARYDQCTVRFLRQMGVKPDFIRLPDIGIHGNGHMMMLERTTTRWRRCLRIGWASTWTEGQRGQGAALHPPAPRAPDPADGQAGLTPQG